ncbi:MAG: nucleotide exchange factor GrpE [Bacteriovoracaceae bacterium]|jgi:molecular chaperone GrpE|nr:nucleotide exchange factor GrpE [Bacteriovoracaceae bacterium]HPV30009.1 nucleotide exchange factor GrpE [Deltaproteobacteria bacterium]HRR21438.1 nucleotide exchange factor GrpE [Desulfomonilia bacterium]HPX48914.1 nucleotide exchange factor GrpE [Deltaproteobacteria bacterium]HQA70352.1 nucleotide exchange factor GrpE [Deltaproteobacteria bacterium]
MDDERKNSQENGNEMTDQYPASQESPQEESRETVDDLAELKAQVEEYRDKHLRALAEMDNMRKRLARERQEIVKFGTEKLLKDFLLVYDAIHKSIDTASELHPEDEQFIEGLRMTEKLFLETLKKYQVEPIQAQNMPFDPNYHDALMQVNKEGVEKGMIVDEVERGFMIHDRVLRPAKVTVSG